MADLHDPREVIVTVNGTEIVGFAEGTFVEGEQNEERFATHVGAKGEVTWVRNADDTGLITLTLKHNSPSNAYLHEQYKSQDEDGAEISISVQDRNFDGDVSVSGSEAKIAKLPNFARGAEVEEVEWEFLVADYESIFSE
ncbi:MAG: DUF3277 family protein [Firmicutes bacterium]|nr:DUF3277 family protein [Bacillota bacterium]